MKDIIMQFLYPALLTTTASFIVWGLNYVLITRKDRKQAKKAQESLKKQQEEELKRLEQQRQEDLNLAETRREEDRKQLFETLNKEDYRSSLVMQADVSGRKTQEITVWNNQKVYIRPIRAIFYQGFPHEINMLSFHRGELINTGSDYDYNRPEMSKVEKTVEVEHISKVFEIPMFDTEIKNNRVYAASYFLFKDFTRKKQVYMNLVIIDHELKVIQKLYSSLDILIYKQNVQNGKVDEEVIPYWEVFVELTTTDIY